MMTSQTEDFFKLIQKEKPEEFYHIAAWSFTRCSFQNSLLTYAVSICCPLNLCNVIKDSLRDTMIFFASTCELCVSPGRVTERDVAIPTEKSFCRLKIGQRLDSLKHIGMYTGSTRTTASF